MNSDILYHVLPRLSRNTLVGLYNNNKKILNSTNLELLLNIKKRGICVMEIKKILALIRLGYKLKKYKFVSECIDLLPKYKQVNLCYVYRKIYTEIDLQFINKIGIDDKRYKDDTSSKRMEFALSNLSIRSVIN